MESGFEVHQLLKDDPNKGAVRIRAQGFTGSQDKPCLVRIKTRDGACAYFEALYDAGSYLKSRQAKDSSFKDGNLIFINEQGRQLLHIRPYSVVELEEIQGEALQSLFAVHGSLTEDSHEGWIWIKPSSQNSELYKTIKNRRPLVHIGVKRKGSTKQACSELLYADKHYLEQWKAKGIEFGDYNVLFLSAWYRHLLEIENSGEVIELDVRPLRRYQLCTLLYRYPRDQPQALVLAASMLGIIGVGLGVIGIGLGVLSFKDWLATLILGFVFCGVGLLITILGMLGLIRR